MNKKEYSVGQVSFTPEGWQEFTSKPYEEQVKQIADTLSPKSEVKAAKLLKGVPNGSNIDGGVGKKGGSNNASSTSGGNGGHNTSKSEADKGGKA